MASGFATFLWSAVGCMSVLAGASVIRANDSLGTRPRAPATSIVYGYDAKGPMSQGRIVQLDNSEAARDAGDGGGTYDPATGIFSPGRHGCIDSQSLRSCW